MRRLALITLLTAACSDTTPTGPDLDLAEVGPPDARLDRAPADASSIDRRRDDLGAGDAPAGCPAFAAGVPSGTVASAEVDEASGLIVSRKNPGVLWVHNDSGDKARIFALTAQGTHLGIYSLGGASADDWEDMASGPGPVSGEQYLYLGDIGDNSQARPDVTVYRVLEPAVSATQAPVTASLSGVEALVLTYPDGPQNAETLLVDPTTGDLVIVSKASSGTSGIYWSPAPQDALKPRALTKVTTLTFGSGALAHTGALTTGGDVAPDGSEVIVRGYAGAALFRRPPGAPLHQAFASPPCKVPLAVEPQGEALSFDAQGKGYTTVSEGKNQPLYHFARK